VSKSQLFREFLAAARREWLWSQLWPRMVLWTR
jgi:hypothetical protein